MALCPQAVEAFLEKLQLDDFALENLAFARRAMLAYGHVYAVNERAQCAVLDNGNGMYLVGTTYADC